MRPPPRSLTQTEISRLVANRPELAGIRARILSLQAIGRTSGVVSAHLSLPRKIAFPDSRDGFWPRLGPPKILSQPSHGRRCAVPARLATRDLTAFRPAAWRPTDHPALRRLGRLGRLRSLRSLRRLLRSLCSLGGLRSLRGRVSSWQVVCRDDVLRRFRCRRHRKSPG
jgi:hypothetical protein